MAVVLSKANIDAMVLLLCHIREPCANTETQWYIVGECLFNWSGGDARALEMWIQWSLDAKSRFRCKCENRWAKLQSKKFTNPRTLATLIKIHQKYTQIPWRGEFTQLLPFSEFDLLQNLPENIQVVHFENEFVSNANAIRFNDNEISCVNSPTGSGKTQLIVRNVQTAFPDIKLISAGSRISLTKVHQKEWGLNSYLEVTTHGVDEVVCIDSLMKFQPFVNDPNAEPFIFVMDEFNSLITHTLNNLSSMSKNRFRIYDVLRKLCLNAKFVVCLDADVTSGALRFIQNLTKLPVTLYINTFKKIRTTPVTHFASKPEIRNDILNRLIRGEKVFVISDDKTTFMNTFVKPFWNRLPAVRELMLVYTSEQGASKDFGDVNDLWKLANVFASPRIIYGIDYNVPDTHHVYFISFGKNTLNALAVCQQIARIRSPLSINIACQNSNTRRFFSLKDVETNNGYRNKTFNKLGQGLINGEFRQDIVTYRNLVNWTDYVDDTLKSSLALHVMSMIRNKGYTNVTFNTQKRRFKFPTLTQAEDKLYNASLLTVADEQYANYMAQLNRFSNTIGLQNDAELFAKMKADKKWYTTVKTYWIRKQPEEMVFDASDTVSQSVEFRLKLAEHMHTGLRLKWFDYDRERDAKTMANARPRIGQFSNALLGQIVDSFPTNNHKNKFKDCLKYKTPGQYYNLLMEMMACLFPALFKPIQCEYRDRATGARVHFRCWKFYAANYDILVKTFQPTLKNDSTGPQRFVGLTLTGQCYIIGSDSPA